MTYIEEEMKLSKSQGIKEINEKLAKAILKKWDIGG